MCIKGKQAGNHKLGRALWIVLRVLMGALVLMCLGAGPVMAGSERGAKLTGRAGQKAVAGVMMGENLGGLTDRVFVSGPPDAHFVISLERGNFLDCGAGMAVARTDEDGRSMVALVCGVTLTETLVIPSASQPARLVIHY